MMNLSLNFSPKGKLFEFIHFDKENNHLQLSNFNFFDKIKGRIAILLHGYLGSATDLQYLAFFLKYNIKIGLNGTPYDYVLIYQYNSLPSIKDIALQFDKDLRDLCMDQQIDVYAHSMGGLVSRYWIEQLNGGRFVQNLITLGTPHAGIPLSKYNKLVDLLQTSFPLAFSLKDMLSTISKDFTENNLFLRNLNDPISEFADRVHYYTLAGSKWQDYQRFGGPFVHSLFGITQKEMDGIVLISSAHSLHLESKSFSWKNFLDQRVILELNHLELLGFSYSKENLLIPVQDKLPFIEIQKWATKWK